MLGRFVVTASRLPELGDEPRALSVIVPMPTIRRGPSADRSDGGPSERRLGRARSVSMRDIRRIAWRLGVPPRREHTVPVVAALAARGLAPRFAAAGLSRLRLAELARFVRLCREQGVVFKATVGLHQPVRSGEEHGFLNLLAAVVFRRRGGSFVRDRSGRVRARRRPRSAGATARPARRSSRQPARASTRSAVAPSLSPSRSCTRWECSRSERLRTSFRPATGGAARAGESATRCSTSLQPASATCSRLLT